MSERNAIGKRQEELLSALYGGGSGAEFDKKRLVSTRNALCRKRLAALERHCPCVAIFLRSSALEIWEKFCSRNPPFEPHGGLIDALRLSKTSDVLFDVASAIELAAISAKWRWDGSKLRKRRFYLTINRSVRLIVFTLPLLGTRVRLM